MYIFIFAQQFGIISAPCQNFLHLHPLHRLLRAGFGGVDGAQGLQVAVRFFRGALHGGNLGFLGFGQVLILRQQVGVAGYDRQRGFQVMGQGGGLLGALLFGSILMFLMRRFRALRLRDGRKTFGVPPCPERPVRMSELVVQISGIIVASVWYVIDLFRISGFLQ